MEQLSVEDWKPDACPKNITVEEYLATFPKIKLTRREYLQTIPLYHAALYLAETSDKKIRAKIRTSGLYDSEWEVEDTKQAQGRKVEEFRRDAATYKVIIDFLGDKRERAENANRFADLCEEDIFRKFPGTLFLNGYKIKCFVIGIPTLPELSSNLVKTAVYMNVSAYNIAPSNSEFQGTDFSKRIFDNIGLVHNYDATNYKHTFTVPQDGIYLIHAYMNFQQGVAKQLNLYAMLERNNVEQSRQSKLIGPYSGADFMFLNEINAGDKIRFTVLQNSGSVIQVSGGCRLNIIRMGK